MPYAGWSGGYTASTGGAKKPGRAAVAIDGEPVPLSDANVADDQGASSITAATPERDDHEIDPSTRAAPGL
jgi:hypothetical protein